MRIFTLLTSLLALLVFEVQPYEPTVFAKEGGGGRTTPQTNVTLVDSTGKLVGNVVGTNGSIYFTALDPSLAGGDSSLVITVNRNRLGGNAFVLFTTADCTGTPYFLTLESLTPQTFVVTSGSSFLLYKVNPASTPVTGTFYSSTTYNPDIYGTGNYCSSYEQPDVTVYASDLTTITLDVTPPFRLVNP
jgi:hypothetical protein